MDSLGPFQRAALGAVRAGERAWRTALAVRGPEAVRAELLGQVERAIEMLGPSKQQFWLSRLREDGEKVRARDPEGSRGLFRALWGMGSLSDCYSSGLEDDAERELRKMLSGAYLKAEYLYEVDSGEPLRPSE